MSTEQQMPARISTPIRHGSRVQYIRADLAERMAEALEGMIAMLEDSMSCMRHRDTRKRFVPGVSDVEIKPDGSLNLSDARSALSAFRSATQDTEARHD